MRLFRLAGILALAGMALGSPAANAAGGGDLLVAPTRVVLDGNRSTEVILYNIGAVPATYRVSLELRRMTKDGAFEEIETTAANEKEAKTIAMVSYAPRKVVLLPNQPQSIRIGVRPPADLPDGEYRAHMLFRAIPPARPVTAPTQTQGVSISLIPIYGVTIPIIVRKGTLQAAATISDAKFTKADGKPALTVALTRTGTRSTYGRLQVLKPGIAKPVFVAGGIAVYSEIDARTATFPLEPAAVAALTGPVTVQYVAEPEAGGAVLAEFKTVLR